MYDIIIAGGGPAGMTAAIYARRSGKSVLLLEREGYGGQIAYGVGCGVLTFLFRYFGSYVEGVSYAILIMNCCVGFFDRIGVPKRFGAVRQKKQKKGGAEA